MTTGPKTGLYQNAQSDSYLPLTLALSLLIYSGKMLKWIDFRKAVCILFYVVVFFSCFFPSHSGYRYVPLIKKDFKHQFKINKYTACENRITQCTTETRKN